MEVQGSTSNSPGSLAHINEVLPLSDNDHQLMQELGEVLRKHNAATRFGITLLHESIKIADDEVMLEGTNVHAKHQVMRPVKASTLEAAETLETNWRLDSGRAVMNCKCLKDSRGVHVNHFEV